MYYTIVKSYRSLISKGPGYAPLIEGEFYYESGKLSEALPKLTASVDEAINAHCLGALVPAMVTIAKIRRAYGDISGAIKILEECEKRVEQSDKPHWSYILKAFKVRLYIDMGNTEMLDKWLAESRLSLFHDIVPAREYEFIVLARVLIEKHRYDDASILLNFLLIFAQQFKRTHSTVEIINLLAITAMKNLNEEAALEYLEKALLIGIEEGYVRSFTDELHPIVTLLEIYIKKHPGKNRLGTYAKDLLNFTKDGIKNYMTQISTNTLENLLTSVEKNILLLIIKAYTNKEISNELGITLRTVKAHTGSIYKKLGVKSRSQCITSVLKIINKSVHDA